MTNNIRKGSSVLIRHHNKYGGKTGRVMGITQVKYVPAMLHKGLSRDCHIAYINTEMGIGFWHPVADLYKLALVKGKTTEGYWTWVVE